MFIMYLGDDHAVLGRFLWEEEHVKFDSEMQFTNKLNEQFKAKELFLAYQQLLSIQ